MVKQRKEQQSRAPTAPPIQRPRAPKTKKKFAPRHQPLGRTALLRARLADTDLPRELTPDESFVYWYTRHDLLAAAWYGQRDEILAGWIAAHPGTRPYGWWLFDAPRTPRAFIVQFPTWGEWVLLKFHAPRTQVGGRGERIEHRPDVERGFPTQWLAVDAGAPPRFESEAAYLKRHALLEPSEEKHLHASDFETEPLPRRFWPVAAAAAAAPTPTPEEKEIRDDQ